MCILGVHSYLYQTRINRAIRGFKATAVISLLVNGMVHIVLNLAGEVGDDGLVLLYLT